jgi:hypothetical protein
MAQYLLSVHGPAELYDSASYGYESEESMQASMEATGRFNEKLEKDGYFVFAGGLDSPNTATTVDGQGEQPVFTDGPYAESKECIAGFWVIEAPDLDVALQLAAAASKACGGQVEVRPFQG